MRCTIEGCNITCRNPQKSMCWKDFELCKYHAYLFYPEIYEESGYRPSGDRFEEICRIMESGG